MTPEATRTREELAEGLKGTARQKKDVEPAMWQAAGAVIGSASAGLVVLGMPASPTMTSFIMISGAGGGVATGSLIGRSKWARAHADAGRRPGESLLWSGIGMLAGGSVGYAAAMLLPISDTSGSALFALGIILGSASSKLLVGRGWAK